MGFSLGRALAGFAQGAADATADVMKRGQIADAAAKRLAEQQAATEARDLRMDEIAAQREARKEEALAARETEKRAKFSTVVKEKSAELREKGIDPSSVEGQFALGATFTEAGYPEQGNIFQDNGARMQQLKDNKDIKQAEMQNRLILKGMSGGSGAGRRGDNAVGDGDGGALGEKALKGLKVQYTDSEGKVKSLPDAFAKARDTQKTLIDGGFSPTEAAERTKQIMKGAHAKGMSASHGDGLSVLNGFIENQVDGMIAQRATAAAAPATAPTKPPKVESGGGILGRLGNHYDKFVETQTTASKDPNGWAAKAREIIGIQ